MRAILFVLRVAALAGLVLAGAAVILSACSAPPAAIDAPTCDDAGGELLTPPEQPRELVAFAIVEADGSGCYPQPWNDAAPVAFMLAGAAYAGDAESCAELADRWAEVRATARACGLLVPWSEP